MKKFAAVFFGTPEAMQRSGWETLNESQRAERERQGMAAWKQWIEDHKASIVDLGTPLGKTKKASARGIEDTKNGITAYTIVQAASHEEAARLFERHPHFTIFPGDSIEIMECLPIPGA